jgi:hypothetical protein
MADLDEGALQRLHAVQIVGNPGQVARVGARHLGARHRSEGGQRGNQQGGKRTREKNTSGHEPYLAMNSGNTTALPIGSGEITAPRS